MSVPSTNSSVIRDIGLALAKAAGLVVSGRIFRDRTLAGRALRKARWLALKHFGVAEVILPFRSRMRLCVRTDDNVIACDVYVDGEFCHREFARAIELSAGWLNHGNVRPVFVDIGANIGTHTLYAHESGYFSRVVSVEPEQRNYQLLLRNLLINGFDTANAANAGLSDRVGTASLAMSADNLGDHRIVDARASTSPAQVETIALIDFATLSRRLGLPQDERLFFWIDTQGHEFEVLNGIADTVLRRSLTVTEFWPAMLRKNGTLERFCDLASRSMSNFIVLQDPPGGPRGIDELSALVERFVDKPYPYDQVDVLWIGSESGGGSQ